MYKISLAALGLLCLLGCHDSSKPGAGNSRAADSEIPTRVTVRDSNVLIDYTDTKKGDTTILFVHGWLINRNYFSDQQAFFQDRYRVVSVDLPGYGQSGKNRNSWTIADFGRDVDSVINELNLDNVILVGHSMSGDIVLDAAVHDTQRVIGIVGVDNFKTVGAPEDPKESQDFQQAIAAMKKNFTPVVSGYFEQALFSKDTDSTIRKRVLADVGKSDSAVAIATMESQNYDEAAGLKRWRKTLHLINSNYTPTDTTGLHRLGLPFHVEEISKSGHFPMVEQPQAFNAALERTIRMIEAENAR